MTAQQLERIAELRAHNYPYSFIGRELGLSSNTVKSICRRRGYPVSGHRKTKAEKQSAMLCKNCHRILTDTGNRNRQFCSDECRSAWWRSHRKMVEKTVDFSAHQSDVLCRR